MKENENKEKKSNNNKYENKPYTGGEANNLFRVPDNQANSILKYCDDRTLLNLLTVNKSWNKKINGLKLDKRKEYLKYFLWYIYGFGNAERLCKVVDDVVNKLDEDKDNKDNIENIIEEDDDKDQKLNEDKKFLFWHMVLLDILNIKMADLKLNFDEEKSKSVEVAINNYLLSDKAVKRRNDFIDIKIKSDHPERLLWEYSRQVFPEFKNIQLELEHVDLGFTKYSSYKYIEIDLSTKKLLRNIFTCFFKVSFYQMQIVKNLDEYKDNQLVYKKHGNQIYDFNRYLQEKIFYYVHGEDINFSKYMAAYLFETGELDQWFLNYKKDFFNFFCRKNSFDKLNEDEINIKFSYFAFYLNKIKPFQTRYKENSNKFWKDFLIDIVKKNSSIEYDVIRFNITPYIKEKSLKDKMKTEITQITRLSNEDLEASRHYGSLFFHHDSIKYYQSNAEKNYFNPIIIRFCGKKDLSDKAVQSISKVIKAKDGEDHKDENKISDENKVSFWQHFIFVLFFIFVCLSLFLCFKISLYFLILVAVFVACDLYLGFKNYCRGCCCALNIKTPAIYQGRNSLVKVNSNEQPQTFVNDELKIQ